MKKILFVALFSIIGLGSALAQQVDLRKKITVSGVAETEVTPDIIYLNISLKEYLRDNNSKKKVEITDLENQLIAAIQKAGLSKDDLTINNLSSWNYVTNKKKNPDFLASKQYKLKVSDLNKYNLIIANIDPKGIQNTNIASYDYSKIEELKKSLKIKALIDAKEKATYMVEAIGEKLGGVLDIQDGGDQGIQPVYSNYMMRAASADSMAESAQEVDFKKIKVKFNVNTVFEIK